MGVNLMLEADREMHKQVCRASIEIARLIGAQLLVQHPGIVPAGAPEAIEAAHARERAALRDLGDYAGKDDLLIAVETLFVEDGLYTADPFRLAEEIEAIGHPAVVGTLDLSHSYIACTRLGLDYGAAVRRFAPLARHLHVHDSFGRQRTMRSFGRSEDIAFGQGDLHLPVGWGDIPYERLLPELDVRSGTVFLMELPPRFWDVMDASAEEARRLVPLVGLKAKGAEA